MSIIRPFATLSLAVCLASAEAAAQQAPDVLPTQRNVVALDLGYSPSPDGHVFFGEIEGQISVHRNVAFTFSLPGAVGAVTGDPASHATPGNLAVGVLVSGVVSGPRAKLVLYSAVSFSRSLISGSGTSTGATNASDVSLLAAEAQGLYRVDQFFPGFEFLRMPVGVELRHKDSWLLRWEVAGLVDFSNVYRASTVGATGESSAELDVHVWDALHLGVRAEVTVEIKLELAALGVEPFIAYEPRGLPLFARLGLLAATAASLESPGVGDLDGTTRGTVVTVLANAGVRF